MTDFVCCGALEDLGADRRMPLGYTPRIREWWLQLVTPDPGDGDDWRDRGPLQLIEFCPFCGRRLPEWLAERWWDELEAMGFDDPHHQDIPEEFRSDRWWKERGL